jgi:hypothetical protein
VQAEAQPVEAVLVLATMARPGQRRGAPLPRKQVNTWAKLAEQVLNAAILAGIAALGAVAFDAFDWRATALTFGLMFLTKLAAYRGLNA